MNIILLGPPGAGKGTEGFLLTKEFSIKRLSVGALLRKVLKEKSSLSTEIEPYVRQGLNVPSDLLLPLLSEWFSKNKNGFIIDNFPRSKEQLELFKKLIETDKIKIDKVFHLDVSKETALERLFNRRKERIKSKAERIDESLDIIKKRFEAGYIKDVGEILEYFRNLGILEEIDAEKNIEEVHEDIMNRLPTIKNFAK